MGGRRSVNRPRAIGSEGGDQDAYLQAVCGGYWFTARSRPRGRRGLEAVAFR